MAEAGAPEPVGRVLEEPQRLVGTADDTGRCDVEVRCPGHRGDIREDRRARDRDVDVVDPPGLGRPGPGGRSGVADDGHPMDHEEDSGRSPLHGPDLTSGRVGHTGRLDDREARARRRHRLAADRTQHPPGVRGRDADVLGQPDPIGPDRHPREGWRGTGGRNAHDGGAGVEAAEGLRGLGGKHGGWDEGGRGIGAPRRGELLVDENVRRGRDEGHPTPVTDELEVPHRVARAQLGPVVLEARPDEVAVDGMRAGIHRLERTKTGVARGIRSDRAGPLGGEDTTVASDPHLRHGSPVAGQSDRVDVTVDRVADQTGGVGGRPGGWRRRVGDTGGRDSGKGCRGRGRRWRDDDVVAPQRGPPIGSREGLG